MLLVLFWALFILTRLLGATEDDLLWTRVAVKILPIEYESDLQSAIANCLQQGSYVCEMLANHAFANG